MLSFLFPFGCAHVAIGKREFDVFIDRETADQIECLEDKTDFAVANARAFGGRDLRDILAVHEIFSTGGRIEQAEQRKQGGLAAAGRAGDGNVVAAVDCEIDIRQRVRFDIFGAEDFCDAFHFDELSFLAVHEFPRKKYCEIYFKRIRS